MDLAKFRWSLRWVNAKRVGILLWCVFVATLQWYSPVAIYTWDPNKLTQHLQFAVCVQVVAWLGFFSILSYLLYRHHFSKQLNTAHIKCDLRPNQVIGARPLLLFVIVILTRMSWWSSPPSPSEDVWRYLWDGIRVTKGLEVYTYAPEAIFLHDDEWLLQELKSRIGHRNVPTIYPPGAQLLFGLTQHISSIFNDTLQVKLIVWRCLLLLADLSLLAVMLSLFRRLRLNSEWLLLYAVCPLISFESALACHLDLFGIFFMMWAMLTLYKDQKIYAGLLLGIGISIKLLPLLLCVVIALVYLRKESLSLQKWCLSMMPIVMGVLISCTLVSSIFLPELLNIGELWPGLKLYTQHWRFNGSVYPLILWLIELFSVDYDLEKVRTAVKIGLVITVILLIWRRSIRLTMRLNQQWRAVTIFLAFFAFFAVLICSPVVFTWYLQWVLPFAILKISIIKSDPKISSTVDVSFSIIVLVWCASSLITYLPRYSILSGKEWKFGVLWSMVEYGTLALTLILIKGYTLIRSCPVSVKHSS